MSNKILKTLVYNFLAIILAVILFLALALAYGFYLKNYSAQSTKNIESAKNSEVNLEKVIPFEKSTYIANMGKKENLKLNFLKYQLALQDKNSLIVLGSSEIAKRYENKINMPYNFLPQEFNIPVFAYGRAYFDVMGILGMLATSQEYLNKDSKILIILSPCWFYSTNLLPQAFIEHFTDEILKLLTKNKLAKDYFSNYLKNNVLEFNNLTRQQVNLLSGTYIVGAGVKANYVLANYKFKDFIYSFKSKFYQIFQKTNSKNITENKSAYILKKNMQPINSQAIKAANWQNIQTRALNKELSNMSSETNWIYREYFDEYIKSKNKRGGVPIKNTEPELSALRILVQFLQEKQVKALFVMQPISPIYYTGYENFIPVNQEVAKILEEGNQYFLDLYFKPGQNFEPGILTDIMHMGELGWAKINEKVIRYFYIPGIDKKNN